MQNCLIAKTKLQIKYRQVKLITWLSLKATLPLLVSAQDFEGWPAVGRDGIKVAVHFELAAVNCTYS
jgi:hypothetical protein